MKKNRIAIVVVALAVVATGVIVWRAAKKPGGAKITPTPTVTVPVGNTPTATLPSTVTVIPPLTETPAGTIVPYPSAPLCVAHDNSLFHTLWNSAIGCHYDHEHGENPFVQAVVDAFPGFDLYALLGNVGIGHTNPSSPMENTHKHGGYKWQVSVAAPQGCKVGFESGTIAVDAYAIQYHDFGPQSVELEARNHSSVALLRQCKPDNPADKGYIYLGQLQEFGERCIGYQGETAPYPDNFLPLYDCAFGQYWAVGCAGTGVANCQTSREAVLAINQNVNSIVTSKVTGSGPRPPGSTLFNLLFRIRDNYQIFDTADLTWPFTWLWMCSMDGGGTYAQQGCRYNNSSGTIHEVKGTIPVAWDGLSGWDTDGQMNGRVTATGFVTRYGIINPACSAPIGLDCQPIKVIEAFVGTYSSELSAAKVSNPTPANTPERDIYFCGGVVCAETDPGASPSGWISDGN